MDGDPRLELALGRDRCIEAAHPLHQRRRTEHRLGGRVEGDQEGAADLLDAAAPELAEGGIDQRGVEPQHPLGFFPGERAEPLRVSAEAGEDDGEVLRLHVGEGREWWPLRNPVQQRTYLRFDSGATGAVGAHVQEGCRPVA